MQFYSPESFLMLWLIPVLAIIFLYSEKIRQKKIQKIGNPELVKNKLMPTFRPGSHTKQFIYYALVFILSTMALARPQWGEEKKKIERKGIDLIFLVDTSLSMLAEDIKPNRLEKSKMEIKNFLRQLKGDRVGMVAFAGSSFLQSPLTLDYAAFQLFVDSVEPGYIPDPGTSLAQSLNLAIKSFPPENLKHKALILFSDGEDHEGNVDEALKQLKKAGIRVYTIGLGTEKGEPIPLKNENGQKAGYKKDRLGQMVITRLNAKILQKIADETGALYVPATPGEQEIPIIVKHMENLEKKLFSDKTITEKEDHFQLFLFLAFLFLCLEILIPRTQKIRANQAALLAAVFFLFSGFFGSAKDLNNEANKDYQNKKYQSATENYRKAQVKRPDDAQIRYNLGTALYQTQDFSQSAQELEKSISQSAKDKATQAAALYNYGNTQYRLGHFEKAIESYQKALELNPDDKDAKYNLEFLTTKKSAIDKKNDQRKKNQKNKQNQKNQNQQKNQQQNQNQPNQSQQNQSQSSQQNQNKDQENQQDQGEKDQNQKNKQDQKEDQNSSGNQDQKDPQDSPDNKQEDAQDNQNQDANQPPAENRGDENDNQNDSETQDQNQNQTQEQPDQSQEQQGQAPQPDQEDSSQSQAKKPLQGQMSMDDAFRILEALKDAEKDLQFLRKPPLPSKPKQVEKDW